MNVHKLLVLLIVVNVLTSSVKMSAQAESKRVQPVFAVIDVSKDGKLGAVADLVGASLTLQKAIILVDRENIHRILNEHKLSAAGITDRKDAVMLGKLLKADGLVLFSYSDDQKAARVRLVDTEYGILVLDRHIAFANENIKPVVASIAEEVAGQAGKLLIPPGERVMISAMSIRNTELNLRLDWVEKPLLNMLMRQLMAYDSVLALEREDLIHVRKELTVAGEPGKDLGSGTFLAKGEMASVPGKDPKAIQVKLNLTDGNGKVAAAVEIAGNTDKLPELAEELSAAIVKGLRTTTRREAFDPKKEAQRFFDEYLARYREDYHSDETYLETAYALDPESREILRRYLTLLRNKVQSPHRYDSQTIYYAIRLADLMESIGFETVGYNSYDLLWFYLSSRYSAETPERKRVGQDIRDRYFAVIDAVYDKALKDKKNWSQPLARCQTEFIFSSCRTPEEMIRKLRAFVRGVFDDASDRETPWEIGFEASFAMSHHLNGLESPGIIEIDRAKTVDLWCKFLDEMGNWKDPVAKLQSEYAILRAVRQGILGKGAELSKRYDYDHFDRFMSLVEQEYGLPPPTNVKSHVYALIGAVLKECAYAQRKHSSNEGPKERTRRTAAQVARYERVLYPLVRQNAAEDLRTLSGVFDFKEFLVPGMLDQDAVNRISKLLCDCIRALGLSDRTSVTNSDSAGLSLEYTLTEFKKRYGAGFGDITIEQGKLPFRILFDLSRDIPDAKTEGDKVPNMSWGRISVSRQGDYFRMPFCLSVSQAENGLGNNLDMRYAALSYAEKEREQKQELTFGFIGIDAKAAKCTTVCRIVGTEGIQDAAFSDDSCFFAAGYSSIISIPLAKAHGIHPLTELSVIAIEPLASAEDGESHNIPKGYISMGCMADILYLGFQKFNGPKGLLAYDLKTRRWDVIASTRSSEYQSLFSELPWELTAGPDGKRLYLTTRSSGILRWYDPASRKFGEVWRHGSAELWRIVPLGDEWWLYAGGEIIRFQPVGETTRRLAAFGPGPTVSWMGGKNVPKGPPEFRLRFARETPRDFGFMAIPGAAVFRNSIWVEDCGRLLCYPLTGKEPDPIVFEPEIFGKDFAIRNIYPSPHGVIIMGKREIILIEDVPAQAKEKPKE